MKMRSFFLGAAMAIVLALTLVSAPHALADDPNRLAQLKVQVWPEYDKPSVLVLMDGTLADTSNLPREISVLIPSTATGIIATFANADSSLAPEQNYKSEKQSDGFTRVTYTVKTANYHFEYYDDLLKGAPDKTMDYDFHAAAPADEVTIQVQQPLKATNWVITPAAQSTHSESGFTYYDSTFSNVTAGQTLRTQVKYTKTDPNPSVVATPVPAPVPAAIPAATPASSYNSVFTIAGLVVLGLAALLGIYLWQQRARQTAPVVAPVRRQKRSARRASVSAGRVFCTQCGATVAADDAFCRQCGAKRRTV